MVDGSDPLAHAVFETIQVNIPSRRPGLARNFLGGGKVITSQLTFYSLTVDSELKWSSSPTGTWLCSLALPFILDCDHQTDRDSRECKHLFAPVGVPILLVVPSVITLCSVFSMFQEN
ncbi:hypothetical protein Pfo_009860, partial [Paulownia fortunei]